MAKGCLWRVDSRIYALIDQNRKIGNAPKFHSGYKLDMDDCRDVLALCLRFGIELPVEYSKFEAQ